MSFRKRCLEHLPNELPDLRCLVIGEVAQSHDGSLGMAHSFIDAVANAGADAVKFQTHMAAEESTPNEPWRVKFSVQDRTRFEYWQRMEFTAEQWLGLKQHADDRGILFLSTPFSERAVDLLSDIGMRVWKIASGEVGNIPLLNRIASSGDPIILSSGMSGWEELDNAVETIRQNKNPLAVLQCTSAYPCRSENIGLNVLHELRERYRVPVGLSDHSGNIYAGLAAVALGAEVLEVHVTLSREMFGPDVAASLTTNEFRQLTEGTRQIEEMQKAPVDKDLVADGLHELRQVFTKSLVASRDLAAGTTLTAEDLKLKKPGTGLPASSIPELIGRKLRYPVKADEMLSFQNIDL